MQRRRNSVHREKPNMNERTPDALTSQTWRAPAGLLVWARPQWWLLAALLTVALVAPSVMQAGAAAQAAVPSPPRPALASLQEGNNPMLHSKRVQASGASPKRAIYLDANGFVYAPDQAGKSWKVEGLPSPADDPVGQLASPRGATSGSFLILTESGRVFYTGCSARRDAAVNSAPRRPGCVAKTTFALCIHGSPRILGARSAVMQVEEQLHAIGTVGCFS